MRSISDALGISRSNLQEKINVVVSSADRSRPVRIEVEDKELIPLIREVTDKKPTYGYRRVTALLNRNLREANKATVNHKRIYRIMKENDFLLFRYGRKPTLTHDGKVMTLRSNTRWCSDSFSIQCFNGDQVHVAFSMDTCDREVISYVASTIGMDGATVRDLIVESVEKRFGKVDKLPHRVQWLTDNGPCYTSHKTVQMARMIGFDVRTTPAYSPESNGMAEAFVKTFKRDYAWFGDIKDAPTVMGQLANWFEDYNENAPHKGLKMLSPRQFIRKNLSC